MKCLQVKEIENEWLPKSSLTIKMGECIVISGPSGIGKSLLLRAIADLDVHEGYVGIDNVPYNDIPAVQWRKQVGLLAAESAWWGEMVSDHIENIDSEQLNSLGFTEETLNWSIDRLSTGEKQRLAILRVLTNKPDFLLLDEPTANLDPKSVRKVEKLLLDYCHSNPAGLIWVSHDMEQAKRIADRRYLFEEAGLREEKV